MINLDVTLVKKNDRADFINLEVLNSIEEPEHVFEAETWGSGDKMLSECLIEKTLKVKVGSQIMFLRNIRRKGIVNGLMGHLIEIGHDKERSEATLIIETEEGEIIELQKEKYEEKYFRKEKMGKKVTFEEYSKGGYIQFPIRLANSFSIHKAQGLTFKKMTFDNNGGFTSCAQIYVCLSRVASLEGLKLTIPLDTSDVKVNKRCKKYYESVTTENHRKRYEMILRHIESGLFEKEEEEED